jgi:hypothetical protein
VNAGPCPSRSPRVAAGKRSSLPSVRTRRVIDVPPVVGRPAVGSPAGLGSRAARARFRRLGAYEFRVKRRDRGVSDEYAIRRARETAFADGVKVSGDPTVTTKRVPLPWIGPRIEFIVRFPQATRAL